MTQFLIEEAAFAAVDLADAMATRQSMQEQATGSRLEDMARRAVGR